MNDNSSNSAFKLDKDECASSSSSPDKKRSRLNPLSTVSTDDIRNEMIAPHQDTEKKFSIDEQSSSPVPSWIAGSSPATFVSLEDLIQMNNCVKRMNIAHKIAMDSNCKIEDLDEANPLLVRVKSNLRKAYWDLLRDDMAKDPPEHGHAFSLLDDLKKMLADHLEGDHLKRFLDNVDEILDMDKLRSLSKEGGLNFESVLKAVLSVMESLCAPIRDELVASLKKETDVVNLFEGIFSLVEFMEIDMANFKISKNRPMISAYSAQLEFDEFEKLMRLDESASDNIKRWLGKILDEFLASSDSHGAVDKDSLTRTEINELITKFYLALLTTDPTESNRISFPETIKLDEKHLLALSEKFLQLELTLSSVFVSANLIGKNICDGSDFKQSLKRDLILILNDVNWSNIVQKLDNVYVHCEHKCKEAANESWDDQRMELLRRQLNNLCRKDDPVKAVSRRRLREFIGQALLRVSNPIRIPPGLGIIQTELASLTSRFYAITTHNWNGFGRFYGQLLDQLYEARK